MKLLKLGIPKGSLEKATIELFRRSGWKITMDSRSYFPSIDDPEIRCTLVRAQEMSRFVEMGALDVGLTGKDWILENESDVVVVQDLVYSKATQQPARWVLVVAEGSPVKRCRGPQGEKGLYRAGEFHPRLLCQKGDKGRCGVLLGRNRGQGRGGLGRRHRGGDGDRQHHQGQRPADRQELMTTAPQLIANKKAWEDPWKREKIEQIATLLKGALAAEGMVGLKMNVPKDRFEEVMKILPSITAPTVADLYNQAWVSVETVMSELEARELIPQLIKKGAVGIIEYPLNKVI